MSKDDATWLNVAYVCFTVLAAFFIYKALELVGIQTGYMERYDWYSYAALALSAVLGVVSTMVLKGNAERHEYFLSAISELRKVTWPSWPDTKRMTIIVCVVCGVFAIIVGLFDIVWTKALNFLIA